MSKLAEGIFHRILYNFIAKSVFDLLKFNQLRENFAPDPHPLGLRSCCGGTKPPDYHSKNKEL